MDRSSDNRAFEMDGRAVRLIESALSFRYNFAKSGVRVDVHGGLRT